MNSVFLFNKYKKFSFLAAGFCPKNLAFARKIVVLPESGGCSLPAPGSYGYGCSSLAGLNLPINIDINEKS